MMGIGGIPPARSPSPPPSLDHRIRDSLLDKVKLENQREVDAVVSLFLRCLNPMEIIGFSLDQKKQIMATRNKSEAQKGFAHSSKLLGWIGVTYESEIVKQKRRTPLTLAAENGRHDVIRILLLSGMYSSDEIKAVVPMAKENGYEDTVAFLKAQNKGEGSHIGNYGG